MSETTEQEKKNQQPPQQTDKQEQKKPFSLFQPVQIQSDSWLKNAMLWNAIFSERGGIAMKERDQ